MLSEFNILLLRILLRKVEIFLDHHIAIDAPTGAMKLLEEIRDALANESGVEK